MNDKDKTSVSKFLSLVLRHNPGVASITLDENGWANTSLLIEGMNRARRIQVTFDDIKDVVYSNDKQRFTFNDDFTKIRANQGHSIKVDVELREIQPPAVLYHGTAERFISSIEAEGLKSKSRLHVHLSADEDTAVKVGQRHGKPEVFVIDAGKMYGEGYKFYLSENAVWLTECVPTQYLQKIKRSDTGRQKLMIKKAEEDDLPKLLELYAYLHGNSFPAIGSHIKEIWSGIMNDPHHNILLGCIGGGKKAVTSCVIVVIPNLTQNQRPYAVIEHVITHPDHRNKGYASNALAAAKDIAAQSNCYKIMLMTGSKQKSTLNFYRRAGYNSNDKTAFIQWL